MCIQKTTRAQLLMLSKAFTGNDMYMSDACHLILSKERHIGQFQWWNSCLGVWTIAAVHHARRHEHLSLASNDTVTV